MESDTLVQNREQYMDLTTHAAALGYKKWRIEGKKKATTLLADILYCCIVLGALGWEGASQVQVVASSCEVLGNV